MSGVGVAWVDIAVVALLLLSVLIGLTRGVVFELLSLAGWVAAYLVARSFTPWLQPSIPVGEPGSVLNHAIAFACVFLGSLVVWSLGARLVRAAIRATPLSAVDRLLGALFGALRGMIVLLVLAALIALTPLHRSVAWQESIAAAWLDAAVQGLKAWWPGAISQYPSA